MIAAPLQAGPPSSAEEALAHQQAGLQRSLGLDCDRSDGDIVVCGRRGADPNRLLLPVQPLPGDREHLLPGDLPRAQASYNTCVIACPRGSGINLLLVFKAAPKIVRHILGEDD
jgi:hypothetical protein